MNLVLPIIIGAVVVGLVVKELSSRVWIGLAIWVCLVCAYYYYKH